MNNKIHNKIYKSQQSKQTKSIGETILLAAKKNKLTQRYSNTKHSGIREENQKKKKRLRPV